VFQWRRTSLALLTVIRKDVLFFPSDTDEYKNVSDDDNDGDFDDNENDIDNNLKAHKGLVVA